MQKVFLFALVLVALSGCSSSRWREHQAVRAVDLWWKQQDACRVIDEQYVNALYHLERMPDDPFLREKQERLKEESEQCRLGVIRAEQEKREALLLWETSIVQNQLELKTIREAEREADERDRKQGRIPPQKQ